MAIYDFFLSRNSSTITANTYIGHAGRLFYDDTNGVVKLSDGVTAGGLAIPYTIASNLVVGGIKAGAGFGINGDGTLTLNAGPSFYLDENDVFRLNPGTSELLGGIKAGPGANIAADGTLTVDTAGLDLSFGDFTANLNTLSVTGMDEDMNLVAQGSGNINLQGNVRIFSTDQLIDGNATVAISNQGFMTLISPVIPANSTGALNIVGSSDRSYQPVTQSGGMIHITSNDNTPSRITNDGFGALGIPTLIARRARGTPSAPETVQAGDVLSRYSFAGWTGDRYGQVAVGPLPTSIDVVALENFTGNAVGTGIQFYNAPIGTSTRTLSANITATATNIYGNLIVSQSFSGRYVREFRNAGLIADGGTLTVDFYNDAIVYCTWGNGLEISYTNFTAGRVVKVIATKTTGTGVDTVNLDGVTAAQVSSGSTTLNASADTTVFLELTCVGTTVGNVFIKV